jgi:hypothetical protein
MHYGFWDEQTTNHADAQLNMNRVLAAQAELKPNDQVLDAGPGTNRRKGKQAQAREALDVRSGQVRPAAPARPLHGKLSDRELHNESTWLRFIRFSEEPRKRVNAIAPIRLEDDTARRTLT